MRSVKSLIIPEIDSLNVTLLIDNFTDRLLPDNYPTFRPPMIKNQEFLLPPMAEHGFSALVEVTCNDIDDANGTFRKKKNKYLFDCGVSENGVIYNADIFGISFKDIDAIILSHGHLDHFMALPNVLNRIGKATKVICHPDAFLKRWIVFPEERGKARMPFLDKGELEKRGAEIITRREPSIISEDVATNIFSENHPNGGNAEKDTNKNNNEKMPALLITGQIPRHTTFEKGFPLQYKEDPSENNLTHDPLVNDDQAIVANIKNKGLVIISGCGHAGIINTIDYAKSITGIDKVLAVIGGFHLTGGGIYEDAIEPTVNELKKANPSYIVPCHCTGWKATNRIIQTMPEKFIQPSVGSLFKFESSPI